MFPSRPHVEILDKCASCNGEYCSKCERRCPKCYSIHIKQRVVRPNPAFNYGDVKRKELMNG